MLLSTEMLSAATHVTTRCLPKLSKPRDFRPASAMNLEIDGTRARGRLFRLTRGPSVQRFGMLVAIPEAGRESYQPWNESTRGRSDEHCTKAKIWRSISVVWELNVLILVLYGVASRHVKLVRQICLPCVPAGRSPCTAQPPCSQTAGASKRT